MINQQISTFLQSRIDANDFPSCVYLVAEKGKIIYEDALGFAVIQPEKIEAKIDTIYDLASLTKPLVTGLLCAKLIENNKLDLDTMIEFYLPAFSTHPDSLKDMKWDTAIYELLTHTSCFAVWKPFYLLVENREDILNEIIKTPLDLDPPEVKYSDLNFLTLTFLLEKLYGKRLDEIANDEIFTPLNLKNTFYNPPKSFQKRIAASELGNEYEKQICLEKGFADCLLPSAFRNYQIWGEVHDGNCYFMNGVSGHAGLFSTAEETFKIAQQFLPKSTQLLKPETCSLFRTNFTPNLNESRSVAFQLAATEKSTASESLAKDSFGHLGFAGTSLWIEPETERIFILLTNRTHAHEIPFVNINSVRRTFHEIATKQLNSNFNRR
jgi:serine-type D-Ala-D-Ala carboxypeptidase